MYVIMLNGNYFVKIVGLIYFDMFEIKRLMEMYNGKQVRKYFYEEFIDWFNSINKLYNIINI